MNRNRLYPILLLLLGIIIVAACRNSGSDNNTNPQTTRKPGETALLTEELVFRSGGFSEKGRQEISFQVDTQGQYMVLLENTHPERSGYWLVWDYIALSTNEDLIWEIGEDESPPDYSAAAYAEFCDPQRRESCITEFVVTESVVGQFSKDLNDGRSPSASIYFTLTDQHTNVDLNLVLSTLYSTHDNADQFVMRVTLIKIASPIDETTLLSGTESPIAESTTLPSTESPTDEPTIIPYDNEETPAPSPRSISILLDDFVPHSDLENAVYRYNRLDGDRGAVNNSYIEWGTGQVTSTIAVGETWGGVWMSLNHPIAEGLTIDFSAILPPQILPTYQSQITGIAVRLARGTPGTTFRLELKDKNGQLEWQSETIIDGGEQVVSTPLPTLYGVKESLWILDDAVAGDYVVVDSVSFTATHPITDTATTAFVWSYGMLLNNWNPQTGLVRDKARHASGEFDAIQATGSLAAATAIAAQLGIIEWDSAQQIVGKIGESLLSANMPRFQGLWPHFVNVSATGNVSIAPGTEWSSVDTAIAAISLLSAQSSLGLDTSGTEEMIRFIAWDDMSSPDGVSHGYWYNGDPIPYLWDVFGGESLLVELAYASATSQTSSLSYPTPPTANGAGFIDELAWLYIPSPPRLDFWGNDWGAYRNMAADLQVQYYNTHYPGSCFDQLGLFGLSAAEVPTPWAVGSTYQAFGVGGRFSDPNDGNALLGTSVVTPHYSAMIASLRPEEAIAMWTWLIDETPFSPLNNVESIMFPSDTGCNPEEAQWNHLKGSWNLALQTLGWGNYLLQRAGQHPIIWQATTQNLFLQGGYSVLVPNGKVR